MASGHTSAYFEVPVTPGKRGDNLVEEEECILVLAPFQPVPKIHFGDVKINTTKTKSLLVRNPKNGVAAVTLNNCAAKDNVHLNVSDLELGPHSEEKLLISWSPKQGVQLCGTLQLKVDGGFKITILVTGTVVYPLKRQIKKKPLGHRNFSTSLPRKNFPANLRQKSVKKISPCKQPQKLQHSLRKARPKSSPEKLNESQPAWTKKISFRTSMSCFTTTVNSREFVEIQDGKDLPDCDVKETPLRRKTYVCKQDTTGRSRKCENKENVPNYKGVNKESSLSGYSDIHIVEKVRPSSSKSSSSLDLDDSLEYKQKTNFKHYRLLSDDPVEVVTPSSSQEGRGGFIQKLDKVTIFTPTPCNTKTEHIKGNTAASTLLSRHRSPKDGDSDVFYSPLSTPGALSLGDAPSAPVRRETYFVSADAVSPSVQSILNTQTINEQIGEGKTDTDLEDSLNTPVAEENANGKKKMGPCNSTENVVEQNATPALLYNFVKKLEQSFSFTPTPQKLGHSVTNITFGNECTPIRKSICNEVMLVVDEDVARRCSTEIKQQAEEAKPDPSPTVCRDLFSGAEECGVIPSLIKEDNCCDLDRLSSETYIKSSPSLCVDGWLPEVEGFPLKETDLKGLTKLDNENLANKEKTIDECCAPTKLIIPKVIVEDVSKAAINPFNSTPSVEANVEDDSFDMSRISCAGQEQKLDSLPLNSTIQSVVNSTSSSKEVSKKISPFRKLRVKSPEDIASNKGLGLQFISISPTKRELESSAATARSDKKSRREGWSFSNPPKAKLNYGKRPAVFKVPVSKESCISLSTSSSSVVSGTRRPRMRNSVGECISKENPLKMSKEVIKPKTRVSLSRRSIGLPQRSLVLNRPPEVAESLKLFDADSVINCIINPGSVGPATIEDPFIASSFYYDEQWLKRQQQEFTNWLNALLTPPKELNASYDSVKVDVTDLWKHCSCEISVSLAPTRDEVSLQTYGVKSRLDTLRYAAINLFRSPEMTSVLSRTVVEVEKRRLWIRDDRELDKDLGLKQQILSLLLNYNPLWLRLGLEVIFGQIIPLQSSSDIVGLTRFIVNRLLSDPYLKYEYRHPTVPNLFRQGFAEAVKKHTLKKFLLLVYFLDRAKTTRLIRHDPCLFRLNAEIKSSRNILIAFSRDFLAGEGDITKHLNYLGYVVQHKQEYIDEYQYAVNNIAVDLRDGVRLVRVMELITHDFTLSSGLRVPAVSRLQKVHNVRIALAALQQAGHTLSGDIIPDDIVNGHREKTLSLLWQIIYGVQQPRFTAAAAKIQQWWRMNWCKLIILRIRRRRKEEREKNAATVIQRIFRNFLERRRKRIEAATVKIQAVWRGYELRKNFRKIKLQLEFEKKLIKLQAFCRRSLVARMIENKKAACIVIQSNFRRHSAQKRYKMLQLSVLTLQRRVRAVQLMRSERQKFQNLQSIIVCLQRWCRGYLVRKFLEKQKVEHLCKENAVRVIQRRFRARLAMQEKRQLYLKKLEVVTKLQASIRGYLVRSNIAKQEKACIVIQKHFRGYLGRKAFKKEKTIVRFQAHCRRFLVRKSFIEKKDAAIVMQQICRGYQSRQRYKKVIRGITCIQALWRGYVVRKNFERLKKAALLIQANFRCYRIRNRFKIKKMAAVVIQQWYRKTTIAKHERDEYLKLKFSITLLQARIKGYLFRKQREALRRSCILVQSFWRGWIVRQKLKRQKTAAVKIQSCFRRYLQQKRYRNLNATIICIQQRARTILKARKERYELTVEKATIVLQAYARGWKIRKDSRRMKCACIKIQAYFRMRLRRLQYLKQKSSAVVIQKWYSNQVICRQKRQEYLKIVDSIILLQAHIRGYLFRRNLENTKNACTLIQSQWRGHLVRKRLKIKNAAALQIQTYFRRYLCRRRYQLLRKATVSFQQKVRAILKARCERQSFLEYNHKVVICQAYVRRWIVEKEYRRKKRACVKVQACIRKNLCMLKYVKKQRSAILIQRWFRRLILMKKERTEYLLIRQSVVTLQACVRGWILQRDYSKKKCACVKIQSFVRLYLRQTEFSKLKKSTVLIQRWYRGIKLARKEREEYIHIKRSATTLEAYIKGYLVRRKYQKILRSCILIQAYWKGYMLREKLKTDKAAAVLIQSYYRRYICRKWYLQLRKATVVIQRRIRAKLEVKREEQRKVESALMIQSHAGGYLTRSATIKTNGSCLSTQANCGVNCSCTDYLEKKRAAVLIQRWFRARKARDVFVKLRKYVLTLQAYARGYLVRKREKQKLKACVMIQKHIRGYLVRRWFKTIQNGVILVQTRYRAKLACQALIAKREKEHEAKLQREERQVGAATRLQQAFRLWKSRRTQERAATTIQAIWRGYQERKQNQNVDVMKARLRIQDANGSVDKKQILGYRIQSVIKHLLAYRSVGEAYEYLLTLDKLTSISPELCDMLQTEGISHLFFLMKCVNRSIPHMQVLQCVFAVLVTLVQYHKTRPQVWELTTESILHLMDIMMKFWEKGPAIFCNCCTFLWILAHFAEKAEFLKNSKIVVERLRSLQAVIKRKKILLKQKPVTMPQHARGSLSIQVHCRLPSVHPPWKLGAKNANPRFFETPEQAVNCLVNKLNLAKQ